jgi:hypothetical protein
VRGKTTAGSSRTSPVAARHPSLGITDSAREYRWRNYADAAEQMTTQFAAEKWNCAADLKEFTGVEGQTSNTSVLCDTYP